MLRDICCPQSHQLKCNLVKTFSVENCRRTQARRFTHDSQRHQRTSVPAAEIPVSDRTVFQAQLRVGGDKFREHRSGAMPVIDCSHQLRASCFRCLLHFDLSSWIAAKRVTVITGLFNQLRGETNQRLFSLFGKVFDASHIGAFRTD